MVLDQLVIISHVSVGRIHIQVQAQTCSNFMVSRFVDVGVVHSVQIDIRSIQCPPRKGENLMLELYPSRHPRMRKVHCQFQVGSA